MITGELEAVLPLEDRDAFEDDSPVRPDGRVRKNRRFAKVQGPSMSVGVTSPLAGGCYSVNFLL